METQDTTDHAYALLADIYGLEAGLDRWRGIVGWLWVYADVETLACEV